VRAAHPRPLAFCWLYFDKPYKSQLRDITTFFRLRTFLAAIEALGAPLPVSLELLRLAADAAKLIPQALRFTETPHAAVPSNPPELWVAQTERQVVCNQQRGLAAPWRGVKTKQGLPNAKVGRWEDALSASVAADPQAVEGNLRCLSAPALRGAQAGRAIADWRLFDMQKFKETVASRDARFHVLLGRDGHRGEHFESAARDPGSQAGLRRPDIPRHIIGLTSPMRSSQRGARPTSGRSRAAGAGRAAQD
jgi:hypothetical protein